MNPAYQHAFFRAFPPSGGHWPVRFAIVTAHNPNGESASTEDNARRDSDLRAVLVARNLAHWPVTGGSEDFSHAESGYGIETDLATALALGSEFAQEAVFWIEAGELFLVACIDGKLISLGRWQERLWTAGLDGVSSTSRRG